MPREMITAYAILKKAAAVANHDGRPAWRQAQHDLIVQVCDEILAGQHHDMFPLHVWMTGSGTQFNMNVNEVISNRCCQLAGHAARQQAPGASQRSRQHVAIVERHLPLRDAHRGRASASSERLHPGGHGSARRDRTPRPRNGRTSSRSAAPTCRTRRRSRSARNGRATPACSTDDLERIEDCAEGRLSAGARRHGGRHRHQRARRASPRPPRPRSRS